MKRLIFLLLTLLCVRILFAAQKVKVDGIYYYLNDDMMTASVTNDGIGANHDDHNCYSGDIVIPSTITYDSKIYNVTEIYHGAFAFCKNVTSVSLPNSIFVIEGQAFLCCTRLRSVNIPNSVKKIKWQTFAYCSNLASITIPNTVFRIEDGAFSYCTKLVSVSIPSSVNMIGSDAFINCRNLKKVTIWPKHIKLKELIFTGCSITDFYCSQFVDVKKLGATIKNVHYWKE